MPDQQVMKSTLQAYVGRTNAADVDGLLALFAPDGIIEDSMGAPIPADVFEDPMSPHG